ncbi:hypothetical protein [Streptomyces sp. H27-C3]|uniref:hypothetical protein n=1 Tax=Streptomyces sp. H27-C3 TaxID=3046305 RepID=UPI0024B9E20B|nr:hypothetical protein [Streptomyces sp. H27-C3]MDJ0464178.1 hypothetical protein [Streptomyces sp. H27-C3]
MVSVFVSFLFIDRIEMKQLAVGLTVAVLFDAIVLRALILPSAMALLGERCWWPLRTGGTGPPGAGEGRGAPTTAVRARRRPPESPLDLFGLISGGRSEFPSALLGPTTGRHQQRHRRLREQVGHPHRPRELPSRRE